MEGAAEFGQIEDAKATMLDRGANPRPVHLAAAAGELLIVAPKESASTFVYFFQQLYWDSKSCKGEHWHGGEDASDENPAPGDGEHFPFPAR